MRKERITPEEWAIRKEATRQRQLDWLRNRYTFLKANDPEKLRTQRRVYWEKHGEKVNTKRKEQAKEAAAKRAPVRAAKKKRNEEERKRRQRERYQTDPVYRAECLAYAKEYKKRWVGKHSPLYRIKRSLSSRLLVLVRALGRAKEAKTLSLVGCSAKELKSHLESMFLPGMSWENYGSAWHVDHIRPCASFDLTSADQQALCFSYSNLQPLWDSINNRKSAALWTPGDIAYEVALTPYPS